MRRFSIPEIIDFSKSLFEQEKEMKPDKIDHMFRFAFEKSSEEIKSKMTAKIVDLCLKISTREKRIADARAAHGITDEILINLLQQARKQAKLDVEELGKMSYSVSNVVKKEGSVIEETITIGAGVVNMLLTEGDFLESEKSSVKRLELIIRNLKDLPGHHPPYEIKGHELSEAELTWLGF